MPIDPIILKKNLGLGELEPEQTNARKLVQYINLKLAAMGLPIYGNPTDSEFIQIANALLKNYQEKNRLLSDSLCPADYRIQSFLDDYLKDAPIQKRTRLPTNTFILDRHGQARVLSLPPDRDVFTSEYVSSYRIHQGVLHNPKNDRRTTEGIFHITEGGLPIPADKKAVPKHVFGNLLYHALNPPKTSLRLPFTSSQENQAETFISLLLRPLAYPEVEGFTKEKTTEIRFFAPGSLVSNLDFVESIFGNAGDPYLPENDAALDPDHWTGHSGCVILAPHLVTLTKKELGLPHFYEASPRQKKDGMCWSEPSEFYNDGVPFKITCRDHRGVMVTLIADNYFGYCKKEVKTQISLAANLYGLCEEEHSGGAIAFRSYDLGGKFQIHDFQSDLDHTYKEVLEKYGELMYEQPEGYAIDKTYPDIFYVPEDTFVDLHRQLLTWKKSGKTHTLKLLPHHTYIYPSGYKVSLEKKFGGLYWRIIGTVPEGAMCHKPCTVSGGGKSEISKSIANSIFQGPVFTAHFVKDLDLVDQILKRDYGDRFREPRPKAQKSRSILSKERTLGSVIKLITPLPEYTEEYNEWLETIPNHIKELIFIVKRFYNEEEDTNWRQHFGVDLINGRAGHELKYNGSKLVANYLRVGFTKDGGWRSFQLRRDYNAAEKLQMEDDITASVIVPIRYLDYLNPNYNNPSVKFVRNCEYRLFQRPDDAIHPGYDKQTEADFAKPNCFTSNYEPLTRKDAKEIIEDAVGFDHFTDAMKNLIRDFVQHGKTTYFVSTAHPRMVDGKPSKNPRYLQDRPDLVHPRKTYIDHLGARLFRRVPIEKPVHFPVNAILIGRRNNPPEPKSGIRSLAVYNPIHYQELPELFMDFICSLTGKSPSTTGAGSEGALTKGPFNALLPSSDLNNTLVSYILTGYQGFSSAAGYIGPNVRVDHDITLLIPEIWCRMAIEERDAKFLIEDEYFEKIEDFLHDGKKIPASRLGYRITKKFVNTFLGRIFNNPSVVFTDEMLRPELQSLDIFVDGMNNIVEAQQRVAQMYFQDGSYEMCCPPLKVLLHIMAHGHFEGKTIENPEIRRMFTREYLLASDWYKERLQIRQASESFLWKRHVQYLESFLRKISHQDEAERLQIHERLQSAKIRLQEVQSPSYLEHLHESLGSDPVSRERMVMLGLKKPFEQPV